MAMNLEEELANKVANEMTREIDREVLWSMLVGIGWTRVIVPSETAMINATLIKEWLEINCAKPHEKHRSDFIFEDNKDATMFILKWL